MSKYLIRDFERVLSKSIGENNTNYTLNGTDECYDICMLFLKHRIRCKLNNERLRQEIVVFARFLQHDELIKAYSLEDEDHYILSSVDSTIRESETKIRLEKGETKDEVLDLDILAKKTEQRYNELTEIINKNLVEVQGNEKYYSLKESDDIPFSVYKELGCMYTQNHKCKRNCINQTVCRKHANKDTKIHRDFTFKRGDYYIYGNIKTIPVNYKTAAIDKLYSLFPIAGFSFGRFVAAGGAILKSIVRSVIPKEFKQLPDRKSDLDLFLVTKSKEEALDEIRRLAKHLKETRMKIDITMNANCISFDCRLRDAYDNRVRYKIQVILRLYDSINRVISGFDIDCCCVAFDGTFFYAMPRFLRSLERGYNIVDPDRQSLNYDERLIKYLCRGFGIALPGYNESFIDINHYRGVNNSGQSKLLHDIEKYLKTGHISRISDYNTIHILSNIASSLYNKQKAICKNNKEIRNEIVAFCEANDKVFYKRCIKYTSKNPLEIALVYSKDIEKIIGFKKGDPNDKYRGINTICTRIDCLKFNIKDPGTQVNGSFNPVNSKWFADCYY